MPHGAINGYIDFAQVVLYLFWIFFAGLCYYLHRENKREGYPLESDGRGGRVVIQGFPAVPEPKSFKLASGEVRYAPGPNSARQPLPKAEPTSRVPGSPIVPTGNPMLDGVGPGSYAERRDIVDITLEGEPRIVPLRAAPGFSIHGLSIDPRGLQVVGIDDLVGGHVADLWVDRSEAIFRYIEVTVKTGGGTRNVLVPMTMAKVHERWVTVRSVLADQLADVPGTKHPDQITLLEEERVGAYFGAATLYATPSRQEPLI